MMDKQTLLNWIDELKIVEFFEALDNMGAKGVDYTHLKRKYIWNSGDYKYYDELKVWVGIFFEKIENERLEKEQAQKREKQAREYFDKAYKVKTIEEKISFYEKAIELNFEYIKSNTELKPDYIYACNKVGLFYYYNNNLDIAIIFYKKSCELKPKIAMEIELCAYACNNLGVIYHKKGDLDKAINFYEESIKLRPDLLEVCNNLYIAYSKKGESEKANIYYHKVSQSKNEISRFIEISPYYCKVRIVNVRENPPESEIYHNLGSDYADHGYFSKASEYYQKAAKLGNENAQSWLTEYGHSW